MKHFSVIIAIIALALSACATSIPIPPSKSEQRVDVLAKAVNIVWETSKEYQISKEASNVIWTTEAINRLKDKGLITTPADAKWWGEYFSTYYPTPNAPAKIDEIERKVREFANKKQPPLHSRVTVDARINATKDRNGWEKGVEVVLPKGVWELKAIDGGWSAWPSNSAAPPYVKGAWTWNILIKRPADIDPLFYGVSDWWQFNSPREALAYVQKNEQPPILNLDRQASVYLWIWDDGKVSDNRDYVTIEISPVSGK